MKIKARWIRYVDTPKYPVICSVIIWVILLGCGPSPADREFKKMMESTKQQFRASELRAAATPLFLKHKPGENILNQDLPKEITSLPLFVAAPKDVEGRFLNADKPGNNGLLLVTGSGFGHWGLIVCPNITNREPFQGLVEVGEVVPWQEGVYFYKDWR